MLAIVGCHWHRQPFTVIAGDLDYCKEVNDTQGQDAGDSFLVGVSVRMKSMVRNQNLIARWSGEEFILLLPETPYVPAGWCGKNLRRMTDVPFCSNGGTSR